MFCGVDLLREAVFLAGLRAAVFLEDFFVAVFMIFSFE